MSKYLQIQIPKACTQSWNEMNAAYHERFCSSCQKNVTDFTLMNDNDLANFFKKNKQNVCGRFTENQLNHDIIIPAKKIPWLKYFFQISIPAFLFSLKSTGQINKLKDQVQVVDTKKINQDQVIKVDTDRIVNGQIIAETGNPIPFVSIKIENSKVGTTTDSAGKFSIRLSPSHSVLIFSAVGFIEQEISAVSSSIKVVMKPGGELMGAIVITGYAVKKKSKSPVSVANSNSFSVFPNPISPSSKLNIKWQNTINANQTIEIYSSAGNLVQEELIKIDNKTNQQSVVLNPLISGTFIIKITDNKTHKFSSEQFLIQ